MVVAYQNPEVRRNGRVNLNLMRRQKLDKTLKPPKDQTRLPQLKPALVETMDQAQSASIRKSSAVFVPE